MSNGQALRVGVGGPVGSGKTALVNTLCQRLRNRYDLADDELASTTPGQAIASALHEALYSRLFRS